MNYREALRTAAVETVLCLGNRRAWRELRKGSLALLFLLLRVALLLTAPVSVPLMAWAILADENARRHAAERAKNDWEWRV